MDFKFKIGDKVEIATKSDMSIFPSGSKGVIENLDNNPDIEPICYGVQFDTAFQWIDEDSLKLIEDESKAI